MAFETNRVSGPDAASAAAQEEAEPGLNGLRFLVVEDEFFLALEVEAALERMGCTIIGPLARLSHAMETARTTPLDGAILDVNLNGEMVFPLAEFLASRNIPFVFITGYTAGDLPERFRTIRRLSKPVDAKALRDAFLEMRCSRH